MARASENTRTSQYVLKVVCEGEESDNKEWEDVEGDSKEEGEEWEKVEEKEEWDNTREDDEIWWETEEEIAEEIDNGWWNIQWSEQWDTKWSEQWDTRWSKSVIQQSSWEDHGTVEDKEEEIEVVELNLERIEYGEWIITIREWGREIEMKDRNEWATSNDIKEEESYGKYYQRWWSKWYAIWWDRKWK